MQDKSKVPFVVDPVEGRNKQPVVGGDLVFPPSPSSPFTNPVKPVPTVPVAEVRAKQPAETLGQVAFEAYNVAVSDKAYDVATAFQAVSEDARNAWEAAAQAVIHYQLAPVGVPLGSHSNRGVLSEVDPALPIGGQLTREAFEYILGGGFESVPNEGGRRANAYYETYADGTDCFLFHASNLGVKGKLIVKAATWVEAVAVWQRSDVFWPKGQEAKGL